MVIDLVVLPEGTALMVGGDRFLRIDSAGKETPGSALNPKGGS